MSIQKNINNLIDKNYENNNFLPKKMMLEDIDEGVLEYIKNLNITLENEEGVMSKVPVIFLTQERWAEFKMNWASLREESGEEIVMPFMALIRTSVKQGTSPLKRTIPLKKKFTFQKVPIFDGTLKGFELFKIPQPVWIDLSYELRFLSHYMQDVNEAYERMIIDGFSDFQGYTKVNGYDVPITLGDPNEENTVDDINADRRFQIIFPLDVHTRLVDPSKFERVKTVTKISINITEQC